VFDAFFGSWIPIGTACGKGAVGGFFTGLGFAWLGPEEIITWPPFVLGGCLGNAALNG
jgi:hypothetical protein